MWLRHNINEINETLNEVIAVVSQTNCYITKQIKRTRLRLVAYIRNNRRAAYLQSRYSTESLLLILQQGTFVHETNHLS